MFSLPRVREGLGVKLRVAEVLAEASVIEGAVHRGVEHAGRGRGLVGGVGPEDVGLCEYSEPVEWGQGVRHVSWGAEAWGPPGDWMVWGPRHYVTRYELLRCGVGCRPG